MPSSADPFAPLVERLQSAARVTLLTDAGVSVASGIPTFRGTNGLWRRHRPESLATPEAFREGSEARLGVVRLAPPEGRRVQAELGS